MDLGLQGKTALVTAASKGLGFACAKALATDGANVVICARGEEALVSAAQELRALGSSVLSISADITDPPVPIMLVERVIEEFGRVDIVVANAGGPPAMRALDVDDPSLDGALNANLKTSVRLVKAAAPHMRSQKWGRICLVTSRSVKQPIPTLALSNTARAGLWGWAKTAADDLFDDGVTLNLVCPGFHLTERMEELGAPDDAARVGNPADFGKVVAFLCSEPAAFVSGAAISVDGATTAGLL